jgi:lipopolysaccharide export system permease protein
LPIVISVLLYVGFHIVSLSGEKAAKTEAWSALQGIWFGLAVFAPIAFFITYQAANDSQLFDKNLYYKWNRKIRTLLGKKNKINNSNTLVS